MKQFFTKDVFGHPAILASILVVVLIAVASGTYYILATRSPAAQWQTATRAPISDIVIGTGSVEPAQNPDLAFVSSGRVAAVTVAVGQQVAAGQLLASLDTGILDASRTQALANKASAQAKLDGLQTGPRESDLSVKQTGVTQAQQSLANTYRNAQATLADAYDQMFSAVHNNTDSLFSQPNAAQPTVLFQTADSQAIINAESARASLNAQFGQWKSAVDALSPTSSSSDTEAALTDALVKLAIVRQYSSQLLESLATAVPSGAVPQSTLTTAQTSVKNLNTTTNTLVASIQGTQQQIAAATLSLQSAQDALAQIAAGATSQDIAAAQASVEAAQASVDNAQAQIRNAVIIAPFSGTVTSVAVKTGQTVAANTVAVSLAPESALQVTLPLSEVDIAKLHNGDRANVTLDAFGSSRNFPATVVSIDRSPTTGTPANQPTYKATLQFTSNDPAIAIGMTANATIVTTQKTDALIVPRSAVLTDGSSSFVLLRSANGTSKQPVQLGIISTSTVEIVSGLAPTDQFLVTAQ